MSYTNAQVMDMLKQIDARLARVERAQAPQGAPVTQAAASPLVIADKAVAGKAAPRTLCTLHREHKDGKGFTPNGLAAHRVWCKGADEAIPSA